MITKEDVLAIQRGDEQWYIVVAWGHALACHNAQILGDKPTIRRANRQWLEFLNRINADVHYDACLAFATASLGYK